MSKGQRSLKKKRVIYDLKCIKNIPWYKYNKKALAIVYEGDKKKNQNYLLEGGNLVVQASPAR